MWVFCGWFAYAGRPRDAAARRPITTVATRRGRARRRPLQNRSADPAFCLATEHLVAVRARRPRLHGQAPRPAPRLEARSPHPGVPQPSFRQRRQLGHKNAPSRRKNAISRQAYILYGEIDNILVRGNLLGGNLGDMAFFNVTVAAQTFGQRGYLHSQCVIFMRQTADDLFDHLFVGGVCE